MKRTIVILIGAGLSAWLCHAQDAQPSPPADGYTIDSPTGEVRAGPEMKEDDLASARKEVLDRFSMNPGQLTQRDGRSLYQATCQGCHMADGKGAKGAGHYPPLADNPRLLSKYYIVTVLLNGLHGMPRFSDQMDDEQIAKVVNYTRSSFGNSFPDTVTAQDVRGLRPSEAE